MLNSKDKIVQLLKDHFNGLGIGIELNNNKLVIRDSMLNASVVIHILAAILAIELTAGMKELYLVPSLFAYAFIAYLIFWVDFQSINIIEFDLLNKNISVTSRSFLRRLVFKYVTPQPSTWYFDEIRGIEQTDVPGNINFYKAKHFVNIRLKNGTGIGLISFSDRMNSMVFSKFITALID